MSNAWWLTLRSFQYLFYTIKKTNKIKNLTKTVQGVERCRKILKLIDCRNCCLHCLKYRLCHSSQTKTTSSCENFIYFKPSVLPAGKKTQENIAATTGVCLGYGERK